jgi:hypothetical protein
LRSLTIYKKLPIDSNINVAYITTISYLKDSCYYTYYLAFILTNLLTLSLNKLAYIVYALSKEIYIGSLSNKLLSITLVYLENSRDKLKLD